jgi:dihydrofolate reductase
MRNQEHSPTPLITIVVAMTRNRVIGSNGDMPWHLPADLKHFKAVTWGKPMIMGRKTFASIGKALPGRRNLVISRSPQAPEDGVEWFTSLPAALAACNDCEEVMIVGGGMLYQQALPLAQRLWLTEVDCELEGDTWFPAIDNNDWHEVEASVHQADERHRYDLRFRLLERIQIAHDQKPASQCPGPIMDEPPTA